jgi:hypothetical protein
MSEFFTFIIGLCLGGIIMLAICLRLKVPYEVKSELCSCKPNKKRIVKKGLCSICGKLDITVLVCGGGG